MSKCSPSFAIGAVVGVQISYLTREIRYYVGDTVVPVVKKFPPEACRLVPAVAMGSSHGDRFTQVVIMEQQNFPPSWISIAGLPGEGGGDDIVD